MSHWIDELAEREREWSKNMLSFVEASQVFLKEINSELAADVRQFNEYSPKQSVDVRHGKGQIEILRPPIGSGIILNVRLYFDPIDKLFIYQVPLAERLGAVFSAAVDGGKMVLTYSQPGVSRETLSRFILTPILFPTLSQDAGILRYLKHQFGIGQS